MVSQQGKGFLREIIACKRRYSRVQDWRVCGLYVVVQIAAEEGDNTCSNLEHGVLKWFHRRDNQRGVEILSSRENIGEVLCSREDSYCRGFVAAHRKIIKEIP